MKAYISGKSVDIDGPLVEARVLRHRLMEIMEVEDIKQPNRSNVYPATRPDYYYLPRQNKPNGITGDGNYKFDLRECDDFILTPVKAGHDASPDEDRIVGLNLYGWEDAKVQRIDIAGTVLEEREPE